MAHLNILLFQSCVEEKLDISWYYKQYKYSASGEVPILVIFIDYIIINVSPGPYFDQLYSINVDNSYAI